MKLTNKKSPTLLVILDGWGVAPPSKGNAITLAKKPVLNRLYELYPSTTLGATGTDVGLEDHCMSGSEAGHMNIGAGRIVSQDSKHISQSIKDKSFFMNPALIGAMTHVRKNNSKLHILGLMGNSDSPHSNPEHFRAVLRLAKAKGIDQVFCHLFTDGRDSYPKSALEHLKYFRRIIEQEGVGKIATLTGRFYAMDRDKHWDRLMQTYACMVTGKGEKSNSPEEAISIAYTNGLSDEYIKPTVILEDGNPMAIIGENDSIIFFNLRSDRAREMTKLFAASGVCYIADKTLPKNEAIPNLYFTAMTDFGPDLSVHTAFPGHTIPATLPMVLGEIKQLYIAESEKFAHITYFLNGGYADLVDGEERVMIKSPSVNSYAETPEMSAREITQYIVAAIDQDKYDFIAVNYANADMVGHTGDLPATVQAVEFLDAQIGILVEKVLQKGGNLVVTADHGNADDMVDFDSEQPNTFHTKNPVPFLLVSEKFKNNKLRDGGVLGNIAPTLLDVLEIEKPKIMLKNSLLR
ncbi:MAG: 2,3-bisphosphoglycerate-independent phosphoglycerate mutase [Parcubacteria group bacterium]|jgi:2,3-bisphosphoglycerate-independent phosphoglycerate mutase